VGFSGTDSFTYEANDGQFNSNVATVTIKVSQVDQPPVATNDSYTTAENTPLSVSAPGVLGNDSDPDGDSMTAALETNPSHGTLTLNADGSFIYVPTSGFSGNDTFTYEANDGQTDSNVATVAIKVSHVDEAPVAANDSYVTAENTILTVSEPGVLGNDSDPDSDTLTAILVGAPSNGVFAMNPDGSFIYVPTKGFSGTDSFTYEANDGQLNSNVATVTINVTLNSDDTIFSDGFD
jgi:VCBS repeat-containing protein